ncbi:MAG TPA: hypothetical protein PK947_01360 [Ottowia sp.]|nr:hypothetical protein [Ottowia sp.]
MKAKLLLKSREVLSETAFVERVLWLLPEPLPGSAHRLKYRLAFVTDGVCAVRYDNERGKGDHPMWATWRPHTRSAHLRRC